MTAVLLHPDPRLSEPTVRVAVFDDALHSDAETLLRALKTIPAIGLAGPHLGIMRRIVALDPEAAGHGAEAEIFVNPEIVSASDETASFEEGSVSMPGVREEVVRAVRVEVAWSTVDGEARRGTFEGFAAACMQHEIDQCDGIFWIARLSRLKRERLLKRYGKLGRRG